MATRRARQIYALAASGLVLGISASAVAAAWHDSVAGTTSFQTSPFGIESKVGTDWISHPSSNPGILDYSPAATNFRPGGVSYAAVSLRTVAKASQASVTLHGASVAGDSALGGALRYRVVKSATCNAMAFNGTPQFVVGSAGPATLTTGSLAGAVILPTGGDSPGAAVPLCFEVSLPNTQANWSNSALISKVATPTWQFVAISGGV
ncbi:hypothetical protein ABH922_003542 [Rhodococcus sp. 27YEA15]|uniref:hypothetical protein n=1 Tax=Rhodococcus sp. 27YEA15 TaxID=3156259 RepID=UPI003C7B7ECB